MLTVVTAFFDLERREKLGRRNAEEYLKYGDFLLQQDVNLIIFIEEEFYYYVWAKRREYGLLNKTYIIPTALEQLDYYRYINRIQRNHKINPMKNRGERKDTPLYTVLTCSKLKLMEDAIKLDPFESTHWTWHDFGLYHIACDADSFAPDQAKNIHTITDKIRIMLMKHCTPGEIADLKEYYSWLRGKVAAGYFSGSKENIVTFAKYQEEEFLTAINLGYAPLEEQVYGVIIAKHPELFDPYHGDYHTVLANINHIRGNVPTIIQAIMFCREHNMHGEAYKMCKKLYDDYKDGYVLLPGDLIFHMFDEYFIAAWYVGRQDEAKMTMELLLKAASDPQVHRLLLEHRERLQGNFSFIQDLSLEFAKLTI